MRRESSLVSNMQLLPGASCTMTAAPAAAWTWWHEEKRLYSTKAWWLYSTTTKAQWHNGTKCQMAWCHDGTIALWHKILMTQWLKGMMARWLNGTLAQWLNGSMALWHNGTLGQWLDGTKAWWLDCTITKAQRHNGTMEQKHYGSMVFIKLNMNMIQLGNLAFGVPIIIVSVNDLVGKPRLSIKIETSLLHKRCFHTVSSVPPLNQQDW